jgi:hypothetical protein
MSRQAPRGLVVSEDIMIVMTRDVQSTMKPTAANQFQKKALGWARRSCYIHNLYRAPRKPTHDVTTTRKHDIDEPYGTLGVRDGRAIKISHFQLTTLRRYIEFCKNDCDRKIVDISLLL